MASSECRSTIFSSSHGYTGLLFGTIIYLLISAADGEECRGPDGAPGPQGPQGNQGTGTDETWYDISPVRNWRQCTWDRLDDSRDSGVIATCQILKESDDTSLYVAWGGVTRITGCSGCCGRWYFTFTVDGSSATCSGSNEQIEGAYYLNNYSGADLHRHRTIQGYCQGLSAGWVDVTMNCGPCSGYGSSNLHTGWNSVSRIIVEEVAASTQ